MTDLLFAPQNIKILVATLHAIVTNAPCVLLISNPTISQNLLNVQAKFCQTFKLFFVICDMVDT